MSGNEHWEKVYFSGSPEEKSWYQSKPALSLELIRSCGLSHEDPLIDVGGGASVLVDFLLQAGFTKLTVLDLSAEALQRSRARLGARSSHVNWVVENVTRYRPDESFCLWHDRAAFHFLTDAQDRAAYVKVAKSAVRPGGFIVLATFAPEGPERCSGLEVARHDENTVFADFGNHFELLTKQTEAHQTPQGKAQLFNYFLLRRV